MFMSVMLNEVFHLDQWENLLLRNSPSILDFPLICLEKILLDIGLKVHGRVNKLGKSVLMEFCCQKPLHFKSFIIYEVIYSTRNFICLQALVQ